MSLRPLCCCGSGVCDFSQITPVFEYENDFDIDQDAAAMLADGWYRADRVEASGGTLQFISGLFEMKVTRRFNYDAGLHSRLSVAWDWDRNTSQSGYRVNVSPTLQTIDLGFTVFVNATVIHLRWGSSTYQDSGFISTPEARIELQLDQVGFTTINGEQAPHFIARVLYDGATIAELQELAFPKFDLHTVPAGDPSPCTYNLHIIREPTAFGSPRVFIDNLAVSAS